MISGHAALKRNPLDNNGQISSRGTHSEVAKRAFNRPVNKALIGDLKTARLPLF